MSEIGQLKIRIRKLLEKMVELQHQAQIKIDKIHKRIADRLTIDIYNLEHESAEQAYLYEQVKDVSIDVSYMESEAKGTLLEVKSLVEFWARKSPKDFGLSRVTEKSVDACINQSDKFRLASNTYNKILHLNRKISGTLTSFDQRRSMLKIEAQLFFADYFNKDTVVDWAKRTSTKKNSDKIRKKLKNKRNLTLKQKQLITEEDE